MKVDSHIVWILLCHNRIPMIKLLRHAETEFNKTGLDELDPKITEDGIAQAKKLTGHYDIVFMSPMRRCRETLEHSGITYEKLFVHHIFREYRKDLCDF